MAGRDACPTCNVFARRNKSWWDRPLCLSVSDQRRPLYWQAGTPALLDIRLVVDLWRAGINPAPTINLSEFRIL